MVEATLEEDAKRWAKDGYMDLPGAEPELINIISVAASLGAMQVWPCCRELKPAPRLPFPSMFGPAILFPWPFRKIAMYMVEEQREAVAGCAFQNK